MHEQMTEQCVTVSMLRCVCVFQQSFADMKVFPCMSTSLVWKLIWSQQVVWAIGRGGL